MSTQIGSVPLHQISKEEEGELSKSSRQQSCVSTSTLAPSNTQTLSSRNEKDYGSDGDRKPRKSIGQRLDHAVLNLAPAFFSLNMVSLAYPLVYPRKLIYRVLVSPPSYFTIYPTMQGGYNA